MQPVKGFSSVFGIICLCLSVSVFSQSDLEQVINKSVDSSVSFYKSETDTAAVAADSTTDDSTEVKNVPENPQRSAPFDIASFKKRNSSIKSRKPELDYSGEGSWEKAFLIRHSNAYKKKHSLKEDFKVFGWHPFWMGTAYKSYNFDLLSVVAYFSYELDPSTGTYRSIHDWKTTALIDSAHKHNAKAVLSVTNFGSKNNAVFLSDKNAQRTFINTLITLLRERNADGVNIDFEGIPGKYRASLTNFIIDLSSSLRSADKNYLITLALPAVDFDHVYELPQLDKYVDLFVIMGYEFYGANSSMAGPVAPLSSGNKWWPYDLDRSVNEYLISGISTEKLLLGLPYYGAEWMTKDLTFPSKAERFVGYDMYRNIKKNFGELECCYDDVSGSKFHVYRDSRNRYRQVWFEDEVSLGKKYDWVIENNIGGIGIWALGYDNGHTELWEMIAEKFAVSDSLQTASVATASRGMSAGISFRRIVSYSMRLLRNPAAIFRNPRPLLSIFGGIFGLSMVGVFVLIRYGNRFKRIYKTLLKGGVALLILILIGMLFITMKYAGLREVGFLLCGFLLAGVLFFFFTRQFLVEKDLP